MFFIDLFNFIYIYIFSLTSKVRFKFFIKWFGLVSTFPKRSGLNSLRIHHKRFGLVFVYINGPVSRQRNRTEPGPLLQILLGNYSKTEISMELQGSEKSELPIG